MAYNVQQIRNQLEFTDENEIIHMCFRYKDDYEDSIESELMTDMRWSKLADYEDVIENQVDDVIGVLMYAQDKRFNYDFR